MSNEDPITRLNAALEGRYRVECQLGEGGMATVYLADDLRHERKVALKVLKPELAAVVGADRFLAEIKTTANLQHPNILPLFDSGEAESFLYYVMPYVEGESLRERLDRERQLPVDEAVQISRNVAEALDYAHRQGVIHRDIKPANILLQDAKPVVSDFGIALAVGAAGGGRLTETGLSLGTPHYMSPEQATGDLSVGPAADIYALGSVSYEMLVGEPPFTGGTPQAVLGKIVTSDAPSARDTRKSVPANVSDAIRKALEKVPADRFVKARDFAQALSDPAFGFRAERARSVAAGGRWRSAFVAGSIGLVAGIATSQLWPPSEFDATVARLNIALPDGAPMAFIGAAPLGIGRRAFDVSNDGRRVVYAAQQDDAVRLFVRSFDSFEATPLPGTEGAFDPFFSPDGRSVGFFVGNQLMSTRTDGGTPVPIAPAPNPGGADWVEDLIVFSIDEGRRLRSVAPEGGPVTDLTVDGRQHNRPTFLPGGSRIVLSGGGWAGRRPWVLDLSSGEAIDLPVEADDARYVPSGHLILLRGSGLHAVGFDADALTVTSPSVAVLADVRTEVYDLAQWDVADDGTLVYAQGPEVDTGPFAWVDGTGYKEPLGISTRAKGTFELSPDQTRLAVTEEEVGQDHIWVYDLQRGTPRRVTVDGLNIGSLAWSPDGSELVYHQVVDDTLNVPFVLSVVTSQEPARLFPDDPGRPWVHSWSASGLMGLERPGYLTLFDTDTGEETTIASSSQTSWGNIVSPTGDAVAYTSGHSGEYHIYVEPVPSSGRGPEQVSLEGGAEEPRWSADGRLLYYRSGRRIMVAPISRPDLRPGTPRVFFEGDFVNVGGRSYDISLDGSRALIIYGGVGTTATLNVVRGWLTEVERLVSDASR